MFESKINRGRANGYAPLDSGSKVPLSYLPPIQSTIDTGSFATTSSLQSLIDVTGSLATTASLNAISESIDGRVSDLEIWSSSLTETFATDLEVSIVSSSVAATIGIVSQATGLVSTSSFNSFTQSIDSRVDSLENKTGSFATTGSNLFVGDQNISGSIIPAISGTYDLGSVNNPWRHIYVNTGSIFLVKDAQIVKVLNTNTIITTTDIASGSVNLSTTLPSGIISGSSQLTSLFDTRYTLSGSVSAVPTGTISGSSQLTSSFDTRYTLSGSVVSGTTPAGTISGSAQITSSLDGRYLQTGSFTTLTASFNSFTASENTKANTLGTYTASLNVWTGSIATTGSNSFNGNQTITGSLVVSSVAVVSGGITIPTGSTISLTTGSSIFVDSSGAITGSMTGSVFGIGDVSAFSSSVNSRINNITSSVIPAGTISGSSQLTSSFDTRYATSASYLTSLNGAISSSTQVLGGSGIYSSSAQLPAGIISGSSQLTTSFDGRYTQTGSFNSYTSSLASSITSVSGTFTNLTVNGQPTTYGVVNPAYLVTGLVNSVNTLGLNQTIILDTTLGNVNSQVSYNNSTGIYTLVAGVTYEMSFTPSFITFSNTTGGFLLYQWVDATTNTPLDSTSIGVGTGVPYTDTGAQNDNVTSKVIYTPSTNQTVKLYVTSANGTATLRGAIGTQAIIKPLNLSVAIQATATGTTSTNFIKYTRSSQQTSLSNGSVIVCNVLENSSGNVISSNTSTGQITLTAGKTYRLKGMVPGFTTSGGDVRPQFCWYNETTAAYIGSSAAAYSANSTAGYGAFGGAAEAIITPNATTIVSFRVLAGATNVSGIGGNTDFSTTGSYPWIDIEEIGSTFALNTLNTMQISGSLTTTGSITSLGGITGSISATNGVISGSSQLTSSYDTRYVLSGSITQTTWDNIASKPSGIISGSSQLPSGLISGSSQLTASYDTRYTLSGSVVSGTTPAGTISGSSQLTSSFDGRYTQTGSFNTLTASFNSFTASAQSVTTGSNSFNGTQTITGSLIISTGSFIGSQITANTASLYLTSGSNLYVQNNSVVEITGSLIVSGSTTLKIPTLFVGTGSGVEGGEIQMAYAQTGSTLTGSAIIFDVYQDKIRIFEGGGTNRGVAIDLSKAPNGVGGDLLWKISGFVNAGTDVTLGNLKARIPTSGNRSLQLSTVSGTYSIYGSAVSVFNSNLGSTTISSGAPLSVSTTPSYLNSGNTFGTAGGTDTWNIMDTTNLIGWRVSCIIGASYNNNLITIERLF
jgi:hypothetical protein